MASDIDEELSKVLSEDVDLGTKLVKVSKIVLKLLSRLYSRKDLASISRFFLEDVCRSRELVLALYFPVAVVLSEHPELAGIIPEELIRQYLSVLLVLYEKSKHVYFSLRESNARQ